MVHVFVLSIAMRWETSFIISFCMDRDGGVWVYSEGRRENGLDFPHSMYEMRLHCLVNIIRCLFSFAYSIEGKDNLKWLMWKSCLNKYRESIKLRDCES